MIAWLLGCGGGAACPEGRVRDGDRCVPYTADDPVPSPAAPLPSGTTWQWQLTGALDPAPDVALYDLDLFRIDTAAVDDLHARGRLVYCYFSAGSFEEWRPDAGDFPEAALGKRLDGWADERWLDVNHPGVRRVMDARLDRAAALGCDGVEPDNVDGAFNRTGFDLNETEQLAFDRFLADGAHARGLGVLLKNDLDQVEDLLPWFDAALNEECVAFGECGRLRPFVEADRAVLHVEYADARADLGELAREVCGQVPAGFSTLLKTWDLGPEFVPCP